MIAKFWIHLPFDLFIRDEEQLSLELVEPEGPFPGIHIKIPVAWGYADHPDPTGTMHEVMGSWIRTIQNPSYSEHMMAEGKRCARVNVIVFEMALAEFDRSAERFTSLDNPLVQFALSTVNHFLARLRVYTRVPQIKPLLARGNRWYFSFTNDDGTPLPPEKDKRRGGLAGPVTVGEIPITTEAVKTIAARWDEPEPYVWDQLLLDADSLWPEVGSSVVMAFSALETFISWVLETLQANKRVFPDELWKWITKRNDDHTREPAVSEEFDNLLQALAGKSLKSDAELWKIFTELKQARNTLVHTGTALIGKTKVDADKAKALIRGADKIIRWVEEMLPEATRRHHKGQLGSAQRRLMTPEEQAIWYQPEEQITGAGAPDATASPGVATETKSASLEEDKQA